MQLSLTVRGGSSELINRVIVNLITKELYATCTIIPTWSCWVISLVLSPQRVELFMKCSILEEEIQLLKRDIMSFET